MNAQTAAMPPEEEEREITRAEKILAALLVVFLLIGGLWVLARLGDLFPRPDYGAYMGPLEHLRKPVDRARGALAYAQQVVAEREAAYNQASQKYQFLREEYRVSLDQGRPDEAKEALYTAAREVFLETERELQSARETRDRLQREAQEAQAGFREEEKKASDSYHRAEETQRRHAFLLQLTYVLAAFALSFVVWHCLRSRGSRYLLVGTAVVVFASLQLVFFLGQFTWYYFHRLSQLIVSLVGAAGTIGALILLKRQLYDPARVARYRLRRAQCHRCSFPVHPGQRYCLECGAELCSECPHCGSEAPVNASYCCACGGRLEAEVEA